MTSNWNKAASVRFKDQGGGDGSHRIKNEYIQNSYAETPWSEQVIGVLVSLSLSGPSGWIGSIYKQPPSIHCVGGPEEESLPCGGGLVAKACLTLAAPWTVACQAPLSMGFPRQEYSSGMTFFFSRRSSRPRDKAQVLHWQADSLPPSHQGNPGSPMPTPL